MLKPFCTTYFRLVSSRIFTVLIVAKIVAVLYLASKRDQLAICYSNIEADMERNVKVTKRPFFSQDKKPLGVQLNQSIIGDQTRDTIKSHLHLFKTL